VIGEPKTRSPIDGLYGGGAVVLTVSAGVRYGVDAVPTPFTSTLTRTSLFGSACDLYWSRYSLEICWPSASKIWLRSCVTSPTRTGRSRLPRGSQCPGLNVGPVSPTV
jgi:hypothetical protein